MFIAYPCTVSGSLFLSSNRRYRKAEKTKPRFLSNVIVATNDNAVIYHDAYRRDTKIWSYPALLKLTLIGICRELRVCANTYTYNRSSMITHHLSYKNAMNLRVAVLSSVHELTRLLCYTIVEVITHVHA